MLSVLSVMLGSDWFEPVVTATDVVELFVEVVVTVGDLQLTTVSLLVH